MKNKINNNRRIKSNKSILLAFLVLMFLLPAQLVLGTAREGVVRPSFMAGDSNSSTDYFIDILLPIVGDREGVLFLNTNFRLGEDSSNEQNIGLVARTKVSGDFILGANLYSDTVRTEYQNDFKQLGVGLELLSKNFDVRGNIYRPFGDRTGTVDKLTEYGFAESSIIKYNGVEEALEGYDAEVGVLVPFISNLMETRVYAGAYGYKSDVLTSGELADVEGEKYRVEVRPSKYLQINVESKHDDIRGSDTFAGMTLEIPFGGGQLFSMGNIFKSDSKSVRSIDARMLDKVVRDRHIIVPEGQMVDSVKHENLIYVNGDNGEVGMGTKTSPYASLASVESDSRFADGAVVYVSSTDDIADTHYVNIAMPDNSVLWGQGTEWLGLGGDGPNPILDGAGGTVINLGENNMVMGFTIQNGHNGIYGSNVEFADIHDNIIKNNRRDGITLSFHDWTSEKISNSSMTYNVSNNMILNNGRNGVLMSTALYVDNSISDVTVDSNFYGNTISGNGAGVAIYRSSYSKNISGLVFNNVFTNNIIDGNSDSGVEMWQSAHAHSRGSNNVVASVTGTTVTNSFDGNSISNNGDYGVTSGTMVTTASHSIDDVIGNIESSIDLLEISNVYTNNIIENNGRDGVYVENHIYPFLSVSGHDVSGDVVLSMSRVRLTNTYNDNIIADNRNGLSNMNYIDAYGSVRFSDVAGDVNTVSSDIEFINNVEGNSITDNSSYSLVLDNTEYSYINMSSSTAGNINADSTNIVSSNNLNLNTINGNGEDVFISNNDNILSTER